MLADMARPVIDPSLQHLLYEWGTALGDERQARGLSLGELARIVGLGPRLTAADIAAAERGTAPVTVLLEISEALDLGVRIELVTADELREEWSTQTRERLRRRRASSG
jgi:transcriptional regulator with XRE-family HTH domain